jgi:putative flippase GtrA
MLQAPLLLLGAALSWLLIDRLSWPEALSFFLIGPSVAMVSFVAQRLWTFAKR